MVLKNLDGIEIGTIIIYSSDRYKVVHIHKESQKVDVRYINSDGTLHEQIAPNQPIKIFDKIEREDNWRKRIQNEWIQRL